MRSIALAMTWEYWRRSYWVVLICVGLGAAVLVLPFGRLMPAVGDMGFLAFMPLLFAMIGQAALAIGNIHRDRLEFPQDLYARPVSTAGLVALRMALAVSAAVVMYLGQALVIRAACGVMLPLWWGPLLALAAAWTHAVVWSLPGLALFQVIGLYLAVYASILWDGFYTGLLVELGGDLAGPGLYGLGTLILTGLAYAVAVVGVRFDRRGDRITLARAGEWISNQVYAAHQTDRPFRSARSAQFWLEWRQHKGWLLPVLNALSFAVYGLVVVWTEVWTEDATLAGSVDFLFALATVNILAYPILAAILVNAKGRRGSQDLLWATRPASDNTLLLVRLRVVIASLLAGWGVWLAGAVVIEGLLWATGQSQGLIDEVKTAIGRDRSGAPGFLLVPVYVAWVALYAWTTSGIVGSLHMTGRRWVAALWMVPLAVPVVWNILVRHLISPDTASLIQGAGPWVIGSLCLAGTGLAYWAALRKGRIRRWLGLTVLGMYIVACCLRYPYPDGWAQLWIGREPGGLVYVLGLMALPMLPLALGPLAVAWNRHR